MNPLPGLIDCHNHLSLDPTLDNYLHRMNDPGALERVRTVILEGRLVKKDKQYSG